ncbi:uncharacterized protein LOC132700561 [Cylas formicarius]|uniref:uncharacterized protein LOC132700561 n=1 Tax=Cylas formicarius TaxID=197179 RepID=UPI0029585AD5|nr:uncharacterized protein LOC132700561 [Cylas formicarius]
MDIKDVQLVGCPCGQHGPYTFYKAFKYTKNGSKRIVTLSEFFFVKMWRDSDLLCIGELQLLWIDKNSEQMLASLRLYFLPENTPEGRMDHGEDEVLAISEKVVIRVEDLITWITVEAEWTWGRLANCESEMNELEADPDKCTAPKKPMGHYFSPSETLLDFSDVEQERQQLEQTAAENHEPHVVILSFQKYCRYRAMMKRLEGVENLYLKYKIVNALGGFYVKHHNTRVLFCRDTFDYPELEGHELLCNHLAPKLKGRPRGKRKKRSVSPGSESNESESSITNHYTRSLEKSNGARSESPIATRRSARNHDNNENKEFMKTLTAFMKSKQISMGRVPSLGYKELNLHEFFTKVQKLGGYDAVTTNRLWKSIFDDMSGFLNSTSAATVVRRHYERFLLAYERHLKGEEHKPLPVSERRRLKSKRESSSNSSVSDAESVTDVPIPSTSGTNSPQASSENKETNTLGKTSSLRSIRVKPERQKEKQDDKIKEAQDSKINSELKLEPKSSTDDIRPNNSPAESERKVEAKLIMEESIKCTEVEQKIETKPAVSLLNEESSTKIEPDNQDENRVQIERQTTDKDASPLTSAVAPIVHKIIAEKTPSPVEGKENIPIIKTGEAAVPTNTPEVMMTSFKYNAPDASKKDSEFFKNLNSSFIRDLKKIKLDILKEGGLEVTPIKAGTGSSSIKEIRPSVIQPTAQSPAKTLTPPSLTSGSFPKRIHVSITPSVNVTQIKPANSTPVKQIKPDKASFVDSTTPPKVVQSKSIYSYSEKTVYGNPKDILQPALVPRFSGATIKHGGGDPIDLSVTSPQKPVVEIMRIQQSSMSAMNFPHNRETVTKNLYKSAKASLLDGRRLGSNLEITLVGPKSAAMQPPKVPSNSMRVATQKRSTSDNYANKTAKLRTDQSAKQDKYGAPSVYKNSVEVGGYSSFNNSLNSSAKSEMKLSSQTQKPLIPPFPQTMPPYLGQFPENVNGVNPFIPLMDSLYYQAALQNAYSNIPSLPPPILPIPTPDQLKLYAELMAHGRLNFPFQSPKDGHPSAINNNGKTQ